MTLLFTSMASLSDFIVINHRYIQTRERLSAIALLQRPPPQVAMRRLTQSTLSPMCFIDREFSMNRGHCHTKPSYCFVFVFLSGLWCFQLRWNDKHTVSCIM